MCISSGCNIGLNKKVCLENISIEKDKTKTKKMPLFIQCFFQHSALSTLTKDAKKNLN